MEYISARDAARKWNVSARLIQRYCAEGRIKGARKSGTAWEIPSDAAKPKDPRKKRRSSRDDLQKPVIPKPYASDEHGLSSGALSGIYLWNEKWPEKGYRIRRISLLQRTSEGSLAGS